MNNDIYLDRTANSASLVRAFEEHGIVVLRDVISNPNELRSALDEAQLSRKRFALTDESLGYRNVRLLLGDILSYEEIRSQNHIFFQPCLLQSLRSILRAPLIYFGDSSFQVGSGARGFHKDNVDRSLGSGPEWRERVALVRVAYYAQHHGTFSGGLKIRQKSHLKPGHLHGKIYDVVVTPRDFVLWDMICKEEK